MARSVLLSNSAVDFVTCVSGVNPNVTLDRDLRPDPGHITGHPRPRNHVTDLSPPALASQEYYMGRVRRTVELVEAQGGGNVLVLNTGGAAMTRRDASAFAAVSPDATVSP